MWRGRTTTRLVQPKFIRFDVADFFVKICVNDCLERKILIYFSLPTDAVSRTFEFTTVTASVGAVRRLRPRYVRRRRCVNEFRPGRTLEKTLRFSTVYRINAKKALCKMWWWHLSFLTSRGNKNRPISISAEHNLRIIDNTKDVHTTNSMGYILLLHYVFINVKNIIRCIIII